MRCVKRKLVFLTKTLPFIKYMLNFEDAFCLNSSPKRFTLISSFEGLGFFSSIFFG